MGWTMYNATNYKSNGSVDRKAELDKVFTWNDDNTAAKVLKSAMVSTTYYAAVETIREGAREVFAVVCLTCGADRRDPYFNFGYKDMDETMLPYEAKCPASILDLLTPTDNENALAWRSECRKNLEAKKHPSWLKTLPEGGQIIYTDYSGRQMRLIKHPAAYQFKTWFWYCPETHKYIKKSLINENNAVPA